MGKPISKWMKIGWGMLAILVAIAVSTCGESEGEKAKKAAAFAAMSIDQRIKSISSNITEVNELLKGDTIVITFFKPSIWDGKNWTWNFLETAKSTLSRMEEVNPGVVYKRVVFMAEIPTRNNLGQDNKQLGMKVTYSMNKLAGSNWKSMTTFDIAELPIEIEFLPLGVEAALEYCKDGDHLKYTPKFCRRAMDKASSQYRY